MQRKEIKGPDRGSYRVKGTGDGDLRKCSSPLSCGIKVAEEQMKFIFSLEDVVTVTIIYHHCINKY